jgi:hypothetical protein
MRRGAAAEVLVATMVTRGSTGRPTRSRRPPAPNTATVAHMLATIIITNTVLREPAGDAGDGPRDRPRPGRGPEPGTLEHAAVNPARCNFRAPAPARRRPGRRRARPRARADRDEIRRIDAAGDDPGRAPSSVA